MPIPKAHQNKNTSNPAAVVVHTALQRLPTSPTPGSAYEDIPIRSINMEMTSLAGLESFWVPGPRSRSSHPPPPFANNAVLLLLLLLMLPAAIWVLLARRGGREHDGAISIITAVRSRGCRSLLLLLLLQRRKECIILSPPSCCTCRCCGCGT